MNHLVLQHPAPEPRIDLTADQVEQVITEIHNAGRIPTREVIADTLSVPVGKIDEHVKNLLKDGHIRRVSAGVYEPVFRLRASRPVTVKRLLTGMVEITAGNDRLSLTPEEERMVAASLVGAAAQFHDLTRGRDLADQFRVLQRQHEQLQDEMRQLMGVRKQAGMFEPPPPVGFACNRSGCDHRRHGYTGHCN